MRDIVISAEQVTRQFGQLKAINQLDLSVERGQIYGFLGPNGCGKTTAIRMLTGLLRPSSGQVNVLGFNLPKDAEALRLHIGYMTQKFSLYDDLTIKENLTFLAQIYGLTPREQKSRIEELLSVYQLDSKSNQLAGSMSGGQRQRLALAGALIHKPQLLILDEPTSAVDPENRRDFWEQLFDLSDQGSTILVSTHYMDEAERCHKLAIIEAGIKRVDDAPESLIEQMKAVVVELSSNNLRAIKKQLLQLSDVISVAQQGTRLRILVKKSVVNPIDMLIQQPSVSATDQLAIVRGSLEDVFVTCTGEGRQ